MAKKKWAIIVGSVFLFVPILIGGYIQSHINSFVPSGRISKEFSQFDKILRDDYKIVDADYRVLQRLQRNAPKEEILNTLDLDLDNGKYLVTFRAGNQNYNEKLELDKYNSYYKYVTRWSTINYAPIDVNSAQTNNSFNNISEVVKELKYQQGVEVGSYNKVYITLTYNNTTENQNIIRRYISNKRYKNKDTINSVLQSIPIKMYFAVNLPNNFVVRTDNYGTKKVGFLGIMPQVYTYSIAKNDLDFYVGSDKNNLKYNQSISIKSDLSKIDLLTYLYNQKQNNSNFRVWSNNFSLNGYIDTIKDKIRTIDARISTVANKQDVPSTNTTDGLSFVEENLKSSFARYKRSYDKINNFWANQWSTKYNGDINLPDNDVYDKDFLSHYYKDNSLKTIQDFGKYWNLIYNYYAQTSGFGNSWWGTRIQTTLMSYFGEWNILNPFLIYDGYNSMWTRLKPFFISNDEIENYEKIQRVNYGNEKEDALRLMLKSNLYTGTQIDTLNLILYRLWFLLKDPHYITTRFQRDKALKTFINEKFFSIYQLIRHQDTQDYLRKFAYNSFTKRHFQPLDKVNYDFSKAIANFSPYITTMLLNRDPNSQDYSQIINQITTWILNSYQESMLKQILESNGNGKSIDTFKQSLINKLNSITWRLDASDSSIVDNMFTIADTLINWFKDNEDNFPYVYYEMIEEQQKIIDSLKEQIPQFIRQNYNDLLNFNFKTQDKKIEWNDPLTHFNFNENSGVNTIVVNGAPIPTGYYKLNQVLQYDADHYNQKVLIKQNANLTQIYKTLDAEFTKENVKNSFLFAYNKEAISELFDMLNQYPKGQYGKFVPYTVQNGKKLSFYQFLFNLIWKYQSNDKDNMITGHDVVTLMTKYIYKPINEFYKNNPYGFFDKSLPREFMKNKQNVVLPTDRNYRNMMFAGLTLSGNDYKKSINETLKNAYKREDFDFYYLSFNAFSRLNSDTTLTSNTEKQRRIFSSSNNNRLYQQNWDFSVNHFGNSLTLDNVANSDRINQYLLYSYWNKTVNNTILVSDDYNINSSYKDYLNENKNFAISWLRSLNANNVINNISYLSSNNKVVSPFTTSIIVNKTLYLSPGIMADPLTYRQLNYNGTSTVWNTNTQLKQSQKLIITVNRNTINYNSKWINVALHQNNNISKQDVNNDINTNDYLEPITNNFSVLSNGFVWNDDNTNNNTSFLQNHFITNPDIYNYVGSYNFYYQPYYLTVGDSKAPSATQTINGNINPYAGNPYFQPYAPQTPINININLGKTFSFNPLYTNVDSSLMIRDAAAMYLKKNKWIGSDNKNYNGTSYRFINLSYPMNYTKLVTYNPNICWTCHNQWQDPIVPYERSFKWKDITTIFTKT